MYWSDSFKQRVLFNASKAYVRQLERGNKYKLLRPVYALALIDENYSETIDYYHHYKIIEIKETQEQIEGLEFVFIELQKFKASNFSQAKMASLWLRFLTEIQNGTEHISEDFIKSPELKKAVECIEIAGFTKAELEQYDKYWDIISTQVSTNSDFLERGKREGLKKGIEEGIQKGRVEGLQKGREEGKFEQKIEIALNMLSQKIDKHTISQVTGIDIEELSTLQEKL
jgi:predicted transposase/invertase (TIGR01784 family)